MPLRIAFLGTPDFAVPSLKALLASQHSVVAVYSQPPRAKGRGYHVIKSPVHELAESHRIPVYTPTSLKSAEEQDFFKLLNLDVAIVVAYGLILPKTILEAPQYGCINVHASILPRWRGASPIQQAILAGDEQSGVTIMLMDEGLDTGPILAKTVLTLPGDINAQHLHDQLSIEGAHILVPTLEDWASGKIKAEPQPAEGVTYAHKLTRDRGELDWKKTAAELERQVRALSPWPGTWFIFGGQKIKVLAAKVHPNLSGRPGQILDDALTVACGQGALQLLVLQREGRQALPLADFLNGFPLPNGACLLR